MSELPNFLKLPPPDLIDTLEYNTILTEIKNDFSKLIKPIDISELTISDPIFKILEIFALREINIRARINECARQVLISSATGSNLDHLGALVNINRSIINQGNQEEEVEYEDDESFRLRIPLAFERTSNAGTKGAYRCYALNTPGVRDVSVFNNTSNHDVIVNYLNKTDEIDKELKANLTVLEPVSDGIVNVSVLPVNDLEQLKKLSEEAREEGKKIATSHTERVKQEAIDRYQERKKNRLDIEEDLIQINKRQKKAETILKQEKNKFDNSTDKLTKLEIEKQEKEKIATDRKAEFVDIKTNFDIKNIDDYIKHANGELAIYSLLEDLKIAEEKRKTAETNLSEANRTYDTKLKNKKEKESSIAGTELQNIINTAGTLRDLTEELNEANTEYILPEEMSDTDLLTRKMCSSKVQGELKGFKLDYLNNIYLDKAQKELTDKYNDKKTGFDHDIRNKAPQIKIYKKLVTDKNVAFKELEDEKKAYQTAKNELTKLEIGLEEQEVEVKDKEEKLKRCVEELAFEREDLERTLNQRAYEADMDFENKKNESELAESKKKSDLENVNNAQSDFDNLLKEVSKEEILLSESKKREEIASVKASNTITEGEYSNKLLYEVIKEVSEDLKLLEPEIKEKKQNVETKKIDKENAKMAFFKASNTLSDAIKNLEKAEDALEKAQMKSDETKLYINEIKFISINTTKSNYERGHNREFELSYYDILTDEKQIKTYRQRVKEKEKQCFQNTLIEPIKKLLNSEEIKPLTDLVKVTLANIVHYKITATVSLNGLFDSDVLQKEVVDIKKSLREYIDNNYKLNQGVTKVGIYSSINRKVVDNIQLEDFILPAHYINKNDLIPIENTAYLCNKDEISLKFVVESYNVGKKELIEVGEDENI